MHFIASQSSSRDVWMSDWSDYSLDLPWMIWAIYEYLIILGRHSYYGGECCPSCRAFFRRSVQSGYNTSYCCVKVSILNKSVWVSGMISALLLQNWDLNPMVKNIGIFMEILFPHSIKTRWKSSIFIIKFKFWNHASQYWYSS